MTKQEGLKYQSGFGNYFSSEALPGCLPHRGNSPQRPAHGLYTEQLSGDAFTAPGHLHQKVWLYRILPSVVSGSMEPCFDYPHWLTPEAGSQLFEPSPQPLRWKPLSGHSPAKSFLEGVWTYCVSGSPQQRMGCATHHYCLQESMKDFFCNADADMLFVPSAGRIRLKTELGHLDLSPGEIAVIQRGIKFQVELLEGPAKGYLCENFGAHFELPSRGAIGANGLASERDFLFPVAAFEDLSKPSRLIHKYGGRFFTCEMNHSPLDVVAWHGNYVPYKYDLRQFNTIGTVSFDHPDPSIFTVLTSPSGRPGYANIDFVIFPPRWMVGEDTFRPPYFHRNLMSEFMGLLWGEYDAKPGKSGFQPGGASLHNCMTPHGPDTDATEAAMNENLKPKKIDNTMAFMFESLLSFHVASQALKPDYLDTQYLDSWQGIQRYFPKQER